MEDMKQREAKLSAQILAKTLTKSFDLQKFSAFSILKQNSELKAQDELKKQLQNEKEARIVMEASMATLQMDLREALSKIEKFEKQERKRIERKKKSIQRKRKQMAMGEDIQPFSIEKSPFKSD